ncbi:hypothetical protein M231_01936 [Tremella mesenterica]|uniref:RNA polymerase I-specific transcription initiation factor RRN6-like protein n=1 Tax=Tremella mesenterica TaxID=5217 RepID=A0A4Q1BRS1_TREME|nr:hypothetical protein M231_01936 [Tremella mesenterica]
MIPPTVEALPPPIGPKGGQVKPRRRLHPWEDSLPDPSDRVQAGSHGVVLDFGQAGGVSLDKIKGKWGWTWAGESRSKVHLESQGNVEQLFPPTRTISESSQLNLEEMTASATSFLQDIVPQDELEGLSDILDEELLAIHRNSLKPPVDYTRGSTMVVIDNPRVRYAPKLLAFPMGQVGHHLNISPFVRPKRQAHVNRRDLGRFEPIAKPMERFETPILQLEWSPATSGHRTDRESTILAVRLQAKTILIDILPNPAAGPKSNFNPVRTERVAQLTYEQTEGRRHADIALDPLHWGRFLMVDIAGGVWLWQQEHIEVDEKLQRVSKVRKLREPLAEAQDEFFRIAFGTTSGTALIMSSRQLTILDIESPSQTSLVLLQLSGPVRRFTALEKTALRRNAAVTCVATTFEVMWVDETLPGIPQLSWRHEYGNGSVKVMLLLAIPNFQSETILLSSSSLPHILAFYITNSFPVRSIHPPHPMSVSKPEKGELCSLVSLPWQGTEKDPRFVLVGLQEDGSISAVRLQRAIRRSSRSLHPLVKWNEEVEALAKLSEKSISDDIDGRAIRKSRVFDAHRAWRKINPSISSSTGDIFSVQALEQYAREIDAPFENFVTAADLVRDVTSEEQESVRSHLLKSIQVDPDTLPADLSRLENLDFSRHLPTVYSLRHPIARFLNDTPWNLEEILQIFPAPRQKAYIQKYEAHVYSLSLDLALSSVILHTDDFSSSTQGIRSDSQITSISSPEDAFASATARLTLNEASPPPLTFHVLSPNIQPPPGQTENTLESDPPSFQNTLDDPTVKSLLSEWVIGENPKSYQWKSWLDPSHPDLLSPRQRRIRPHPSPRTTILHGVDSTLIVKSENAQVVGKGVPTILRATASVPMILPTRASSPVQPLEMEVDQSQERMWASTQVERGPFGGKVGKKKIGKKRVGGF